MFRVGQHAYYQYVQMVATRPLCPDPGPAQQIMLYYTLSLSVQTQAQHSRKCFIPLCLRLSRPRRSTADHALFHSASVCPDPGVAQQIMLYSTLSLSVQTQAQHSRKCFIPLCLCLSRPRRSTADHALFHSGSVRPDPGVVQQIMLYSTLHLSVQTQA